MASKNPPPCKYRTGRTLGQGTYAVVKEVFHIETGERFAAKVLNKTLMRGREHLIRNEIDVLTKVSTGHPNIVSLIDYFETSNNLYLVMEIATGGELFDRIWEKGVFYENEASTVIRTVIDAVKYLHDQEVVHRDLKPENLIYSSRDKDSTLLVADFGLAKIIDPEQFYSLVTTCGTPGYMAPEIYLKTGYGKPVDMWAIGVITYFLLSGEPPFNHNDSIQRVQMIINADFSFKFDRWSHISVEAKNFISQLLKKNPEQRLTAKAALLHPWLNQTSRDAAFQNVINNPISFNIPITPEELDDPRPPELLRRSLRKAINVVNAVNFLNRIEQFPIDEEVGHA